MRVNWILCLKAYNDMVVEAVSNSLPDAKAMKLSYTHSIYNRSSVKELVLLVSRQFRENGGMLAQNDLES